jgi:hypothetical protein
MLQIRWWCLVATAMTLVPGTVKATQDYAGDVYPQVSVQGDRFVVTFKNNKEDKVYREVYARDGERLINRTQAASFPPYYFERLGHAADNQLKVRRSSIRHFGRDPETVWRGARDGNVTLTFPEFVRGVHDVISRDGELVALVMAWRDRALVAYRFAMPSRRLMDRSFVDTMPRYHESVSNLVAYRDGFLVSWMDENARLRLAFFTPGHQPITITAAHGEWNTWPTMDVIGDDLLVAFHTPGKEAYAVIVTVHIRLPLLASSVVSTLDDAAAWMAVRAERARQGAPELVRIPLAFHFGGRGYRGPLQCVAANLSGDCGPPVTVVPRYDISTADHSRYGVTTVVAEGIFTGRRIGGIWEFDAFSLDEVGGPDEARLTILQPCVRPRPTAEELRQTQFGQ